MTVNQYQLNTTEFEDGVTVYFRVRGSDELGFYLEEQIPGSFIIANSLHQLSLTVHQLSGQYENTISIVWEPALDTWEREILYDVLYSADYGNSWFAIVKDYQVLNVDWDTRTVNNGEYLIQVSASDTQGDSISVISQLITINNLQTSDTSAAETVSSVETTTTENQGDTSSINDTSPPGVLSSNFWFFVPLIALTTLIKRKSKTS